MGELPRQRKMSKKDERSQKPKKNPKNTTIRPIPPGNRYFQLRYNEPSYVNLYDSRYQDLQQHKFDQLFLSSSQLCDMILDIGTGTGLLWTYIAEKLRSAMRNPKSCLLKQISSPRRFIGIDFAMEMLRSFQEKTHQDNSILVIQPHLICADGEHLPLRDCLFSEIYSITTLQNLSDPLQGLREIRRVSNIPVRISITMLRKKMGFEPWIDLLKHDFSEAEFQVLSTNRQDNYEEDWIAVFLLSPIAKTM